MYGWREDDVVRRSRISPSTATTIELGRSVRISYFGIMEWNTCTTNTRRMLDEKKSLVNSNDFGVLHRKLSAPSFVTDS